MTLFTNIGQCPIVPRNRFRPRPGGDGGGNRDMSIVVNCGSSGKGRPCGPDGSDRNGGVRSGIPIFYNTVGTYQFVVPRGLVAMEYIAQGPGAGGPGGGAAPLTGGTPLYGCGCGSGAGQFVRGYLDPQGLNLTPNLILQVAVTAGTTGGAGATASTGTSWVQGALNNTTPNNTTISIQGGATLVNAWSGRTGTSVPAVLNSDQRIGLYAGIGQAGVSQNAGLFVNNLALSGTGPAPNAANGFNNPGPSMVGTYGNGATPGQNSSANGPNGLAGGAGSSLATATNGGGRSGYMAGWGPVIVSGVNAAGSSSSLDGVTADDAPFPGFGGSAGGTGAPGGRGGSGGKGGDGYVILIPVLRP